MDSLRLISAASGKYASCGLQTTTVPGSVDGLSWIRATATRPGDTAHTQRHKRMATLHGVGVRIETEHTTSKAPESLRPLPHGIGRKAPAVAHT